MFLSLYSKEEIMLEDLCDAALSIKLNHSEDGDWSEHHSLDKEKENFKIKCFRCYGKGETNCRECKGTQMITNSHPLAFLLGQVLDRKLSLSNSGDQRVCPIKEEEEEVEDRKTGCVVCSNDCGQDHENQCEPCYPNKDVISGSVVQMDLSEGVTIKEQQKLCYHCSCFIENCYSVCKTCISIGQNYWLCDVCSDQQSFTHPHSHIFQPIIDYDVLKDNKIQTISQQFQDESHQSDFPDEHAIPLEKKNSSIANYLEEDSYNFLINNSGEMERIDERSRVKFQLEGLFSSYDFKSIQKLSKPSKSQQKTQYSSKGKSKTNIMKENMCEEQNLTQHSHYVFVDYKCDFCDLQPIINIRYHCKACDDYDLCQKCFQDCDSIHEHQSFDRVDGRVIKQKALERLFQSRDINLRATNHPDKEDLKLTLYPPMRKLMKNKSLHYNSEHIGFS